MLPGDLRVGIEMERAHGRVRWLIRSLSQRAAVRLPWSRFSKPPYDPGRSDFPSPVLTSAPVMFIRVGLPPRAEV